MSAARSVLALAMAGTQRQRPAIAGLPAPLAELLQQPTLQQAEPPQQLLRLAAVIATCEAAGHVPPAAPAAPPAAAPDRLPPAAAAFTDQVLLPVLAEGPDRLRQEVLRSLAAAGLRLPARALPAALEAGRRSVALRPALLPALGERGLWLAAAQPAWQFAAGASADAAPEALWQHGTQEQRRQVLQQQRATEPAAARERLAGELGQMAARERAELLPCLEIGLGPEDEPLLDGLLKDRSKEVRQAAARLLVRLPQGRQAQALGALLAPLVRHEKGFLRSRWEIDAPAAADPHWKDLGLDPVRPQHESLGERAWWLYQIVRLVPPAWWTGRTGMAPPELLDWAGRTEWAAALVRGWREAVLAAGDAGWAEALLEHRDPVRPGADRAEFLRLLPFAVHERLLLRDLGRIPLAGLLAEAAAACPPGRLLSPAASDAVARAMAAALTEQAVANDYALRYQLPEAACLLDPAALRQLKLPQVAAAAAPGHAGLLAELGRIQHARLACASLTPQPGNS